MRYSTSPETWSWATVTYGTRSRSQVTASGSEISGWPKSGSGASSRTDRAGSTSELAAPVWTVTVTGSGEGHIHGQ